MTVLACQTPVPQPPARRSVRPSAERAPSAGTTGGDSTADLRDSSVCSSRPATAKPAARAAATTPKAPVTASAPPVPTWPPTATAATATTGHAHGEASTAGHALPPRCRTSSPAFPTVSRSPRASQGRAAGDCISPVSTRVADGPTMGRFGDTGGDRVRTVRSAIGLGLAAALAAVMTSPLLGYEHPSPRPPGERKGSTRTTKCPRPSCGGTARKKPDGLYSCSECGQVFDEPLQESDE